MILLRENSGLKTFGTFLSEANSVGAKFEEKTAKAVRAWLKANGLNGKFEAKRYQPLRESGKSRNEDYSDIIVQDLGSGRTFFIECKEFERSNVLNLMFDIAEDGSPVPVKGTGRKALSESESERFADLTDAVAGSEGYRRFVDFLNGRNGFIKNLKPAQFWFDEETEDAGRFLPGLIKKYNAAVRAGKTEADCKEFDPDNLRDSTKNVLLCALCWRLSDPDNTWDICKVGGVKGFGGMIRGHYADGKAEAVKYIQFGDDKLFAISDDNPFGLKDVPVFPDDADGEFSLKFTPRFGTGSVYVTPRSEIKSEMNSDFSFVNKDRWPKI